tara:strand:+ start:1060 stop:1338 length:279 start_codon:yes stop_codon:yes gene_type:complete
MEESFDQGASACRQIERFMDLIGIQECDREEPVYQQYDGKIYVDLSVYELRAEQFETLYNLISLTAQDIYAYTAMGTNKYRGLTRIEIEYYQ